MPADRTLIYWDSCVFISFLEGHPDRIETLQTILADCRDSATKIVTSAWTLAEVSYVKCVEEDDDDGTLHESGAEAASQIDRMWTDSAVLLPVELTPQIALLARSFSIEAHSSGRRLQPKDAVHLATAQHVGAVAFHSYDQRLRSYEATARVSVGPPNLLHTSRVGRPGEQRSLDFA